MLAPEFQALYYYLRGSYITNPTATNIAIISPQIGPINGYASGMGTMTVGGSYVPGQAVITTQYAEVLPVAVVATSFLGGSAAPTVTVTGTDHTGAAGQTWTGTFSGNNPAAALATLTVTSGAIVAQARQQVTISSSAGIVPGSVLTVNKGKPDQESVIVETVPSGTIVTAVFNVAHAASATLDGNTTIQLTNINGRRLRSVSNVALGLTGHTAGVVRIEGAQDRAGV
jgi:hypothetical protein